MDRLAPAPLVGQGGFGCDPITTPDMARGAPSVPARAPRHPECTGRRGASHTEAARASCGHTGLIGRCAVCEAPGCHRRPSAETHSGAGMPFACRRPLLQPGHGSRRILQAGAISEPAAAVDPSQRAARTPRSKAEAPTALRKTPSCTLLLPMIRRYFIDRREKREAWRPLLRRERSKVADQDSGARGADGVSHMGPPDAGGGLIHEFSNLLGIVINYTALIDRQLGALERAPTVAPVGDTAWRFPPRSRARPRRLHVSSRNSVLGWPPRLASAKPGDRGPGAGWCAVSVMFLVLGRDGFLRPQRRVRNRGKRQGGARSPSGRHVRSGTP